MWSEPAIVELAGRFVACADEVWYLQHARGPEGELFRQVAEQGHYAGRTTPTDTRQGIYAFAPSGILLASINSNDPARMEEMLRRALDRWDSLSPEERRPQGDLDGADRVRPEGLYPGDGLVLRVNTRDLPREEVPEDWRSRAWNQDFAWFRHEEVRAMLPGEIGPGGRAEWPAEVVRRLARLHLLDTVRGQTPPYPDEAIESASIATEVTAVDGGVASVRFEGSARIVHRGRWPVRGFQDMNDPTDQERGFDARILGRARFDVAAGRFVAFEMLAVGPRWGATQYNGRGDDPGPAPMGIAFTLAGDTPAEHVAPANWWGYGWRR